ncbi:integrase [Methylohalomonas lacus]|uniref:Integrase n=1 Tax=Methylohalomonas lacus TaxID=398773 RepID=A0AAE3HKH9_9GAMM|nr:integrase arm-type DNA-binding domain-containing protein [Methylohalomonas lacus]MCS3902789.1 integrase [Methylohalomonas lacus]
MAGKLTDKAVRGAGPLDSSYKLSDGGGLYLLVHANGSKYWRLKYRFHGKEKTLALGVYPDVSLATAREGREEAKKLLKNGQDPSQLKKQARRTQHENSKNTLEAVARQWLDVQRGQWTEGHLERVRESLEKDIFPDLGERPLTDITPPELLMALRKIEKRGALETAQRVMQRTSAIFRYGIASGLCTQNPASELRGTIKTKKATNMPAMSAADLPDFLRKLDAYEGRPETKYGLQLIVLTFVRPGELRAAEWSEFNLKDAEWRIPAERTKMKTEHIVPLSVQAMEVIEAMEPLTGRKRFVFPNQSRPKLPMSENTLTYALYRMGYHSRATAHGFRATASTILNEQGWPPDVIERQLAHAERNKVRAAYNRAQYLAERRKMMQAWADYLDAIKQGAEIVPISAGK